MTDAFEVLRFMVGKRLAQKRLTVVEATTLKPEDKKHLVNLAREFHVLPVALVFDLPPKVCPEREPADEAGCTRMFLSAVQFLQ